MNTPVMPPLPSARLDGRGLAAAATAFFIWGLLPLYLKMLQAVPVLQITAHRLVWGCVLALIWLAIRGELSHVRTALFDARTGWRLCLSALLISVNWITYVYGIASGQVVETSLGYFINPLVNVLLGVLVLSERLNRVQWTAVAIAAAGVSYLTWSAGHLPWIALALAFSFGLYGLVRKLVKVDALAGFASETLVLLPLGIAYLVWCEFAGSGVIAGGGFSLNALLVLGGPLTAIPLVLFAFGARRIPYSTVGLLQYIGPTIQLVLAVHVFHEPFTRTRMIGFSLIWTALAIYAADGVWRSRKLAPLVGDPVIK
ncbi:MAG TPA: EamA family transporter RarD [Steroidobacteraceae bacterium]|nr:EamA family transporter RarD [Steroidobacteraceae bacterium]